MSENKELDEAVQSVVSVEDLLSAFGVKKLSTAKDEGMLSFKNVKDRLIKLVEYNIEQFQNNSWSDKNQMLKMLVDKKKQNIDACIFSLRIMGKQIFRCSCKTPTDESKVEFLISIKALLETGGLDNEITNFCEKEVLLAKERKKAARERKRKKDAEKRELEKKGRLVVEAVKKAKKKAAEAKPSGEEPVQAA